MNKDWTGNSKSIYTTLGASNHTDQERVMTTMRLKVKLLMLF